MLPILPGRWRRLFVLGGRVTVDLIAARHLRRRDDGPGGRCEASSSRPCAMCLKADTTPQMARAAHPSPQPTTCLQDGLSAATNSRANHRQPLLRSPRINACSRQIERLGFLHCRSRRLQPDAGSFCLVRQPTVTLSPAAVPAKCCPGERSAANPPSGSPPPLRAGRARAGQLFAAMTGISPELQLGSRSACAKASTTTPDRISPRRRGHRLQSLGLWSRIARGWMTGGGAQSRRRDMMQRLWERVPCAARFCSC